MNFYIDPAFYMFLSVAIVPAAILGFSGHRIKYYGLAASLVFLLLLFGENLEGMFAFVDRHCLCGYVLGAFQLAVGAKGTLEVSVGARGRYRPSGRLQDRRRVRSESHGISGDILYHLQGNTSHYRGSR